MRSGRKGATRRGDEEKEWCGERDRGKQAKRRMNSRSDGETKGKRERKREQEPGDRLRDTHWLKKKEIKTTIKMQ